METKTIIAWIIIGLMALSGLSVAVFAQSDNFKNSSNRDCFAENKDGVCILSKERNKYSNYWEDNRTKNETGINNALVHVTNENARERLQTNLVKFVMNHNYTLKCENCDINLTDGGKNRSEVVMREHIKFFGRNITSVANFTIDDDGKIVKEKHNFGYYMYKWGLAKKVGQ